MTDIKDNQRLVRPATITWLNWGLFMAAVALQLPFVPLAPMPGLAEGVVSTVVRAGGGVSLFAVLFWALQVRRERRGGPPRVHQHWTVLVSAMLAYGHWYNATHPL